MTHPNEKPPVAVSVKGLEWEGNHAKSIAGPYSIVKHHNHYGMIGPDDSFDGFGYRFEGPLEKCKEAAQSDFNARILSSIIPATKGGEALRDAMRQAMDIYQADAERDIGEAMFMVLHTALSQGTDTEVKP